MAAYEPARTPDDLGRLIIDRINAADIDGIMALYEPDAAFHVDGQAHRGTAAIRAAFQAMLDAKPAPMKFVRNGEARIVGDVALTSAILPDAITTEVSRKQSDGTWRYAVDVINILPAGWGPRA